MSFYTQQISRVYQRSPLSEFQVFSTLFEISRVSMDTAPTSLLREQSLICIEVSARPTKLVGRELILPRSNGRFLYMHGLEDMDILPAK
jgi:hypothetical protein